MVSIFLWKKYCETLNVFVQAVITYETVTAQIAHQETKLLDEKYSDISGQLAKTYSDDYDDMLKENPTLSTLPRGRSTKLSEAAKKTFEDMTKTEGQLFSSDTKPVEKSSKNAWWEGGLSRSFLTRRVGRKKTRRSKRKRTRRK